MARVAPIPYEQTDAQARAEWDRIVATHGRMTNMKQTLAHSATALKALMQWYPLCDEVEAFLGHRATMLFVHAISSQNQCLICSTFFRRILIEEGEDPDRLELNEQEQAIVDYGRQLTRDANAVSDALFERLQSFLSPKQLVLLTAFGGLMVATNLFNNALKIELDDYLEPFRQSK